MRIRLYSIKDRLLNVYLSPFAARADIEAIRQIRASLDNPQLATTGLVQSPSDYDLCYLATMEDETGEVFPEQHSSGPAPAVVMNVATIQRGGHNGTTLEQSNPAEPH